jgi:type VI secretion system protein ImpC
MSDDNEVHQDENSGTTVEEAITLKRFLSSMSLATDDGYTPSPVLENDLAGVKDDISEEDRFLSSLAVLLFNVDRGEGRFDKAKISELLIEINGLINDQVNEVLHNPKFQQLESVWRGVSDLRSNMNFKANMTLDLLDVTKDELFDDFENNAVDITGSAIFQKVYVSEYDQFGGRPFGTMLGLYEFSHTPDDLFWLQYIGKVANAAHAPFISSISPKFLGCETISEVGAIKDLEGLLNQPKYGAWQGLRDTEEAAYLSLAFPRYSLRLPYNPDTNPCRELKFFTETVDPDNDDDFLWGNSALLVARNMAKSFETSSWCQYIRGPKAGGLLKGLPCYTFNIRGEEEVKLPVELSIPDFRELEFANSGIMPLIYRKGTAEACFFSAQSIKLPKRFKDPKDSENAQLVCNLSYTLSITRLAHYIKSIMRDNIGSTANASYIQAQLEAWLNQYITTVSNPDDLTLRHYPFKAASVEVVEKPGHIGQYSCKIAVLPHIQFEGMDVELRLDSRLG